MDKVRLIFTDDDLWIFDADNPSAHSQYMVLVGSNLDVESVSYAADKLEAKRGELEEMFPDITWHDMRKGKAEPAEEPTVVVYDDPDAFLGDMLSPQWPPPD
jgi:hypothetical protein